MQMLAGVRIYVKIISYTLIQPLGYERIYERQLFVYIVLLLVITNFKIAFFIHIIVEGWGIFGLKAAPI